MYNNDGCNDLILEDADVLTIITLASLACLEPALPSWQGPFRAWRPAPLAWLLSTPSKKTEEEGRVCDRGRELGELGTETMRLKENVHPPKPEMLPSLGIWKVPTEPCLWTSVREHLGKLQLQQYGISVAVTAAYVPSPGVLRDTSVAVDSKPRPWLRRQVDIPHSRECRQGLSQVPGPS